MTDLGIVLLDTDAIIKLANMQYADEPTLLEHLLSIKGEFYIHEHIVTEVQWPEHVKSLLMDLISNQKINNVKDEDLMMLIQKDDVMSFVTRRTFLSVLKDCCEIFGSDYYEDYYNQLEHFTGNDLDLVKELYTLDLKIMNDYVNDTNLGEIKTAFLAALFYTLGIKEFCYFVSDDRRARSAMVLKYHSQYHSIKTISVIGCFYYLKTNGFPKELALKYINCSYIQDIKYYSADNTKFKIPVTEALEKIYNNEIQCRIDGKLVKSY